MRRAAAEILRGRQASFCTTSKGANWAAKTAAAKDANELSVCAEGFPGLGVGLVAGAKKTAPENLLACSIASGFHRTLEEVMAKSNPPEDAQWEINVTASLEQAEVAAQRDDEKDTAEASHILVKTLEEAQELRTLIDDGVKAFGEVAEEHSNT